MSALCLGLRGPGLAAVLGHSPKQISDRSSPATTSKTVRTILRVAVLVSTPSHNETTRLSGRPAAHLFRMLPLREQKKCEKCAGCATRHQQIRDNGACRCRGSRVSF